MWTLQQVREPFISSSFNWFELIGVIEFRYFNVNEWHHRHAVENAAHTHTNTIQRDRDVLVNRKWLKRTRVWVSELFVGACVRVCASVLNVRFLILTFLSRSQFTVIDVYNCSLPNCLLLFTLIHQTFSLPPPSLLASFTCSRFHLISRSLVTSVNAWWIWCLTVAGNLSL